MTSMKSTYRAMQASQPGFLELIEPVQLCLDQPVTGASRDGGCAEKMRSGAAKSRVVLTMGSLD